MLISVMFGFYISEENLLTIFLHAVLYLNVTKMFCFKNKLWWALKSGCCAIMWNGRYHGASKWTTVNHTKCQPSSKEGDVYIMGLEGSPLLWASSEKPNDQFQQVLLPVRPTENRIWQKASELVNRKRIIFHQDNARPLSLMPRRNCYSLTGRVLIHSLYFQTLHLQISITSVFTTFS